MSAAIAKLLTLLTTTQEESTATSTPQGSNSLPSQTRGDPRLAACLGAKRRAHALLNHRATIARWTAAGEDISDGGKGGGRLPENRPSSAPAAADDLEREDGRFSGRDEGKQDGGFIRQDLVSLVCVEGLGRHLVATAWIPAGTVLIRERPFAWCLEGDFSKSNCAHCLSEIARSPTRCATCLQVAFCSPTCSATARQTWHRKECLDARGRPLEPALSGLSSTCRLAVRALRRSKRAKLQSCTTEFCEPDGTVGQGTTSNTANVAGAGVDEHRATRRFGFADLEEHYKDRPKLDLEALETEAAIAAVLAYHESVDIASVTSAAAGEGIRSADKCGELAAELLPSLCKVSTNGFVVSALRRSLPAVGQVETLRHDRIAVGLYCAAAMLNHSCRPNAAVTFHGGQMDVLATRSIEPEEAVTISYGPLASKVSSTSERRRLLQDKYFFRCDCDECRLQHDPSVGEHGVDYRAHQEGTQSAAESTEFACVAEGCPGALVVRWPSASANSAAASMAPIAASPYLCVWCARCGSKVSRSEFDLLLAEVDDDRHRWDKAVALALRSENATKANDDVPKAIALVNWCTSWRDRRIIPNSLRRAEVHDLMARLLVIAQDFVEAAKHCGLAVTVLERRFAPEDRELGVELAKLAHICFNAGMASQCVDACHRARVSLRLYLREGDEQLAELDMMESYCLRQSRSR